MKLKVKIYLLHYKYYIYLKATINPYKTIRNIFDVLFSNYGSNISKSV